MSNIVLLEGNNELNVAIIPLEPVVGWISPTSYLDPDGKWSNEEWAYDGDIISHAKSGTFPESWGSFLVLNINPSYIDKVRFWCWHGGPPINKIDLDVYYGGRWHDIPGETFPQQEWVERALAGTYLVDKARVRFYNSNPDWSLGTYLQEFQFHKIA